MRGFLKSILRQIGALILAYTVFCLFLVFLFAVLGVLIDGKGVEIRDQSILLFDLNVNIKDSPQSKALFASFAESLQGPPTVEVTLKDTLDAINRAAKDDRIAGLFLFGSPNPAEFGSNYPNSAEIRRAIKKFSKAGKPVLAYLIEPSIRDYYLATAAEKVIINPFGYLKLNGLSARMAFFGNAFEEYGVGIQISKAGRFKSASETFTRDGMSEENREQTERWIQGIWNFILDTISEDRGISIDELRRLSNEKGLFRPEEALEEGLVDAVHHYDVVLEEIGEIVAFDDSIESFAQVRLPHYIEEGRDQLAPQFDQSDRIAVVYIEGEIVSGEGDGARFGGDRIARELRKLRQDEEVKAVVLRINTPGGSALATEIIEREVQLLGKEKPIVVSMGGYAASGGYWITTSADIIFADPSTITGSIGVFSLFLNLSEIANRHGVTFDGVKTSPFADIFDITRARSKEEIAVIDEFTEFIYEAFLERVGDGRGMHRKEVEAIAQGRVWTGADAIKLGLVDRIGGLEAAIDEAVHLGALAGSWRLEEIPRRKDFSGVLENWIRRRDGEPLLSNSKILPRGIGRLLPGLTALRDLNDPLGIYARMPFFVIMD